MKKLFFLVALSLYATFCFAQETNDDPLMKKRTNVPTYVYIEKTDFQSFGAKLEKDIPGDSLMVTDKKGTFLQLPYSEIKKIKYYYPPKAYLNGGHNKLDIAASPELLLSFYDGKAYASWGVDLQIGKRATFNSYYGLSVGILSSFSDVADNIQVPILANYRYHINTPWQTVSPYVSAGAGYTINTKVVKIGGKRMEMPDNITFQLMSGISKATSKSFDFNLGAGLDLLVPVGSESSQVSAALAVKADVIYHPYWKRMQRARQIRQDHKFVCSFAICPELVQADVICENNVPIALEEHAGDNVSYISELIFARGELKYGYQFTPKLYLGIGAGVGIGIDDDMHDKSLEYSIFANPRYYFNKHKVSPFFDIEAGIQQILYKMKNIQGLSPLYGTVSLGMSFGKFEISGGIKVFEGTEVVQKVLQKAIQSGFQTTIALRF